MTSSTEILVAPVINERLRSLCSCSFLSVPHPGGISERHPFWMCRRKCSISLVVREFPKGLLGTLIQRSMREFKFFSSCSLAGVYFSLAEPWSSSLLKICENSRMNEFAVVLALFKVFCNLLTRMKQIKFHLSTRKYFSVFVSHITTVVDSLHIYGFVFTVQSLFYSLQQVFYL